MAEQNEMNAQSFPPSQPEPVKHKPISSGVKIATLWGFVALALIIVSGIYQRSRAESTLVKHTEHAAAVIVNVVKPTVGHNQPEVVLPGNTQAFYDTSIFARTSGYLKRWYVDIGAHVHQGQILAEIETPEVDQQLEQARADLKNAQANEELAEITASRWQNLLKSDSVSKQETDQAISDLSARKATVASMAANVHRLEQLQSFEKIYAPFSGVITSRSTDIGALIDAGAGAAPKELFHMAAVDRLRIYVAVPEVDAQVAQNGAKAILTLDEYPGEKFVGTIVRDSDSIDPAMRTLRVEVDIDNAHDRIKTGAYVLAHFAVPKTSTAGGNAVTLPSNVLLFRSEGLRAAVMRQGKAELVPVQIGRDYGSSVEVVTGIRPDDQVIVNPSDSLTSGTPVRVTESSGGGQTR